MSAAPPRIVSLAHVKADAPTPHAAPKKQFAHPQTEAIYTNKEEATMKFLKKKAEQGQVLTAEQKALVAKFTMKSASSNSSVESVAKADSANNARLNGLPSSSRFQVTADGGLTINRSKQGARAFQNQGGGKRKGGNGNSHSARSGKSSKAGKGGKFKGSGGAASTLDSGLSSTR